MESTGSEPDRDINKESDDEESNNEEGYEELLEEKLDQPKRTSAAWEFFDIKDSKRKVATCKLCSCECSYWSTVSNLMKHVQRKHGVMLDTVNTQELRDGSRSKSNSPPIRRHSLKDTFHSSLWSYYKRIDHLERLAMCLVCKKQLSYKTTISNLRKHLKRQHPDLNIEDKKKQVILSSDGQLYEVEETKSEHLQIEDDDEESPPTLDIDSVFIDSFDGDVKNRSKKRKLDRKEKKRKKILIEDTGRSDNDTSSDEITFQKRYIRKKNDSLDQFGKYLISLMKQLPKELSNQLQMDFLKQVMTAQMTYDTQKKGTVPSNGYAITITNNKLQNTNDHQYVVEECVVETQ